MAKFEELAVRYMTDLMHDFGLKDFQAAGIVGNGGAESGGFTEVQELKPTVKGSAGGLGHFQWTGRTAKNRRRLDFEEWLARNADKGWTAHTYEANYSMLFRELNGSESAALAALKRTKDLDDAARVFCMKFERPGILHMDSRIRWANRAMTAYRNSPKQIAKKSVRDAGIAGGATGVGQAAEKTVTVPVDTPVPYTEILIWVAVIAVIVFATSFAWRWWRAKREAEAQERASAEFDSDDRDAAAIAESQPSADADHIAAEIANKAKGGVAFQDAVAEAMKEPKRRPVKKAKRAKKRRKAA